MTTTNLLENLDKGLGDGTASATPSSRLQTLKVLRLCSSTLGVHGLQGWVKRIAHLWGVSPENIISLLEKPEGNEHLLYPTNKPITFKEKTSFPKTGFINDYIELTRNSEAPTTFHFWTAVSIVGGLVSRAVWFPKGHYRVYPNHFIVFVAPSGICRKTSAISIGVKLLRSMSDVNILSEKITPEALVAALQRGRTIEGAKECSGFIQAPELAVFLGKQLYNEGLITTLTRLADSPDSWEFETRTKAVVKLVNVSVSMLGASTKDWLEDCIPQSAFGGGFMSRILFVVQNSTNRLIPFPPPVDIILENKVKRRLEEISKLRGEFTQTLDACKWYEDWYATLNEQRRKLDDPRLCGYMERKPDHLIRLTMVLAICESDILTITAHRYQQALKILESLESLMPDAFVTQGESAVGANSQRVLNQLQKAGQNGLQHSILLKKNHRYMDATAFKKCMATLAEAKLVERVVTAGKAYYFLITEGK